MAGQFCTEKLEDLAQLVNLYRIFMLSICVLLLFFSFLTIVGNLLVLHAMWKASSIPANVKKLFLSLAFSDIAVGLFGQLMLGVIVAVMLAVEANENFVFLCPVTVTVCHFFTFLLISASFLSITAIAVDRLLAISCHLRYQELVTSKRGNIALVCLWITSGVAASVYISLPQYSTAVAVVVSCVGLPTISVAYFRIYKVIKYHRNQIHSQLQVPNTQETDLVREKKSALNAVYVYVVFLVCYLPMLCSYIWLLSRSFQMSSLVAEIASVFLVFLNSSLNPALYCWRYREIRENVKSAVKKIFRINDTGG